MLARRKLHPICLACRLRILPRQLAAENILSQNAVAPAFRSRPLKPYIIRVQKRTFTSTGRVSDGSSDLQNNVKHTLVDALPPDLPHSQEQMEAIVRQTRRIYGDMLPEGFLTEDEYVLYERLYGAPIKTMGVGEVEEAVEEETNQDLEEEEAEGTILYRTSEDGKIEKVQLEADEPEELENAEEELLMPAEMDCAEEEALGLQSTAIEMGALIETSSEVDDTVDEEEDEDFVRGHPLTSEGRWGPSPSTIKLPQGTYVDPATALLARSSNKHLDEAAERLFGGKGFPHSTSTPRGPGLKQQPIGLDSSQTQMGEIEADVFTSVLMPGFYASVMSSLVEVRKRLGSEWVERLFSKPGGPRILDTGSGGAGVLAWRDILRAEWDRIHEDTISRESVPLGRATVVTGADSLRHRASRFLDNTTFLPRLPDYVSPNDEQTAQPRKQYDIIIASHTLWPIKEDYMRKHQVQNLWSLLNPSGGVLILIEKGLPRGFEAIAGARALLLDKHIASPGSLTYQTPLQDSTSNELFLEKETGMIIAPCTNHGTCPMYAVPGTSQGRKDLCHFSQRYIRPPFLQRTIGAKVSNHEDVKFSYLAVQRGRDLRSPTPSDPVVNGIVQGDPATKAAFEGHDSEANGRGDVSMLTLPRNVLPPIKSRGHVILDLCTPSGTLERWTVPKSWGKVAYRDARKARWGDLWALGAKTRVPRNVRLGAPVEEGKK
ncbi:Rsm22-domain-containing protein, partial [Patellaria atrata CBS 101060]